MLWVQLVGKTVYPPTRYRLRSLALQSFCHEDDLHFNSVWLEGDKVHLGGGLWRNGVEGMPEPEGIEVTRFEGIELP